MNKAAFHALYAQGFCRVAACTPVAVSGDPAANAEAIVALAQRASDQGAAVAVFPELCVTGYAIDDLLLQDTVLDAAEAAIAAIAKASETLLPVLFVGAPLRLHDRLYNCAVAIHRGAVLGVTPKSFLPNYREFYEKRWFAAGAGGDGQTIVVAGSTVPFGPDVLFAASDVDDLIVHAEICEDLWSPAPPSQLGALAGATLLLNLSASNIVIGKASLRATLCAAQSSRLIAAYVYCAAGAGDLGDQVVLQPEPLRQRTHAIHHLVRGPARHQRRDACRQLLVEHPVGEELGMVGGDEGGGGRVHRHQETILVRARQVDVDDVGQTTNAGHAVQAGYRAQARRAGEAQHPVHRGERAHQAGTGTRRDEGVEAIAALQEGILICRRRAQGPCQKAGAPACGRAPPGYLPAER